MLYFKIDDPMIDSGAEISEDEVEREITKRLKMKGLLLSDVKVVREMDREISGYSIIIPANIKADGTFGQNSSIASEDDFDALRKHVKGKIIGLCQDMINGNIDISPYKNDKFTPCSYCSFKAVCRFDSRLEENSYRRVVKFKNDEVWGALRQEAQIEGGES
jgi:ATP-dependent helicase/nuclease subunit B